jgi:hypothetical protein
LRAKDQFHRKAIYREGNIVHKESSPWTATVHSLLRHLEAVGFTAAPRVVGQGFDSDGYETLTYIDGEFMHPGPWTEAGSFAVGSLLRSLHEATRSYQPPDHPIWYPWYGRTLGRSPRIISQCDVAPWNIVTQNGLPVALIDWDYAGPVDPLVDLAQACWLNAKLHDDIVAHNEGLAALSERAKHFRAIVDGYGLAKSERVGLVDLMIEFAIHSTAADADEANIMPNTDLKDVDAQVLWAMAWRSRGAAWMLTNKPVLESALS